MYRKVKRLIALFIIVSICITNLEGYLRVKASNQLNSTILPRIEQSTTFDNQEGSTESYNWEDYIGDLETFVYGLVIQELRETSCTFPGTITLSDGYIVSGIGYTDYSEGYYDISGNKYYMAGFIPYCGELDISNNDFEQGLIIDNIDDIDDNYIYIMKYGSSEFKCHCIAMGQYIVYGVDATGKIFYNNSDYKKGMVIEKDLGSLYSYDEAKYVYISGKDTLQHIKYFPSDINIDYTMLSKLLKESMKNQDDNFVSVEIETYAYQSKEAVCAYLLEHQEESFLGYSAAELLEYAKNIKEDEYLRITPDQIENVKFETPKDASRWLVATVSLVFTIAGIACSSAFIECPPLLGLSNSVTAAWLNMFMQAVGQKRGLTNIDILSVLITAFYGAISGYIYPSIASMTNGTTALISEGLLNGFLGGAEQMTEKIVAGNDFDEAAKSFGTGLVLAFVFTIVINGGMSYLSKYIAPNSEQIANTGKRIVVETAKKKKKSSLSKWLSDKIDKLKKYADSSKYHSDVIAERFKEKFKNELIKNEPAALLDKAIKKLSNKKIYDANTGKKISKDTLKNLFYSSPNGKVIAYYKLNGEKVSILKENGLVSILYDKEKYVNIILSKYLVNDRKKTFADTAEIILDEIKSNPSKYPNKLVKAVMKDKLLKSIDLKTVTDEALRTKVINKVLKIIRTKGYTLHENIDMVTITLVPNKIHDKATGLTHMGGYGLAKYIKEEIASKHFDDFISILASGTILANPV